jgi:hypothetical protein
MAFLCSRKQVTHTHTNRVALCCVNIREIYANARGPARRLPGKKKKQELNNDLLRLSFTTPRDFRKKSRGGEKEEEEDENAEP